MIDNRQGGRRGRGRGGPRPQGNPGRPGGGGGNRIDNRARGNAQQLHEKYKNLARDSQMAGDRVTTEYYLQFADHYFRVLSESRARFEEQRPRREDGDDSYDGDEGEEFEARDDRGNRDNRDYGQRDGGGQRRDGQSPGRDRNFRRDDDRRDRQPEQAGDEEDNNMPVRANDDDGGDTRQRRPRRPRREDAEQAPAFDAGVLPPSIAAGNDVGDEEEPAAPRRRGRRPRTESANDAVEVPPAA